MKKVLILFCLIIFMVSCINKRQNYEFNFDLEAITTKEDKENLNMTDIVFYYLDKESIYRNSILFSIDKPNSMIHRNILKTVDNEGILDFWIEYNNKKYKIDIGIGDFYALIQGNSFSFKCKMHEIDVNSDLYAFFVSLDELNEKRKIKVLKKELPLMKAYINIDGQISEIRINDKTRGLLVLIPNSERDSIIN
ncbi:hypothetical protein [Myroides indicus]|nr:hypothetical protein [Myroides indicus]